MQRRFAKTGTTLVAVSILALALVGCEGPEGPMGPPGEDAAVSCLECHNTEAMQDIMIQYARSGHALGEYVDYAGGRSSCARCHSGPGFQEYALTGDVGGNINDPAPISCSTCHSVHTEFEPTDFALRLDDPVVMLGDAMETVDFGGSANLCANCHQARRGPPTASAKADSFEITSTHYGPHHGPQTNVLNGTGFAEIAGSSSYDVSSIHMNAGADCVTCHMGAVQDNTGGHTWWPTLSACNNCHTTSDFDYGDVQTDVQALLDELQTLLADAGVIEYVEEDEAWEPVVGTHSLVQAQAFFNWIGLSEDRSLGVHNPRYVVALLENSIEAMQAR